MLSLQSDIQHTIVYFNPTKNCPRKIEKLVKQGNSVADHIETYSNNFVALLTIVFLFLDKILFKAPAT